jgi:hypothetical protein
LSYVAIGAALVHPIRLDRLGWTLLGFFLGLGIGAHALDERHGHPMRTGIRDGALTAVAALSIAGAAVDGWLVGGLRLLPFIAVGALFAVAYNLEWFGGLLHNGVGLAISWGAFPVLTGYYAQRWTMSVAAIVVAVGTAGLTWVQRTLSTPARWLRRTVTDVKLTATNADGSPVMLTSADVLRPLEVALRMISWSLVAIAIGLVIVGPIVD